MAGVLVKIRGVNCEGKEWMMPSDVNFRLVLDVIAQVVPGISPLPTAFEYEDEDGDRITVCSDDELAAMLTFCQWRAARYGGAVEPVSLYPKASRWKNHLRLEVNTRAPLTTTSTSNPGSGEGVARSGSFRRANEQSLVKLIAENKVASQDLQYLEILGHGSGGTVYRTFHQSSKIIMAVKVLALDVTSDEQKQIMAELEILHKCNSRYIIGFYGAFFQENRISICTEYVDGGSLEGYGSLPEEVLGRITVSVVKGLSYLWSLKILHRDIKPSNMLVNSHGHVKLCDFGVSVQLLNSLTKTFIGTNAYMAPERILGGEYGIHSEVWSLGVSLLEMSLGRFPYLPEGSRPANLMPFELLQCIVNEKPPSLPPDRFSPELINFTSQCMQKLPKARTAIDALLRHPFVTFYDDGNEEVISSYVRRRQEQQRIRNTFKRFPSDLSLSSTSSGWSGASAHSGSKVTTNHMTYGHPGQLTNAHYGDPNSAYGHSLYTHGLEGGGGGSGYDRLYTHGVSDEGLHPLHAHGLDDGGTNTTTTTTGGGTFHMDTS